MAHKLLLLTQENDRYREFLSNCTLPNLVLVDDEPHNIKEADIWLAEPNLAAPLLGHANHLKWLQSTTSSVDALMRPRLRQDYLLTNINGALSPVIAEYIFSHLLTHQPELSFNLPDLKQTNHTKSLGQTEQFEQSSKIITSDNPQTNTQPKIQIHAKIHKPLNKEEQKQQTIEPKQLDTTTPSNTPSSAINKNLSPLNDDIWHPRSFHHLQNQHLLVLGTGITSRYIAKIAKQFGMLVSGVNRTGVNIVGFDRVGSMRHLPDFIAQADVIINSYPTTRQSRGLINEKLLSLLKPQITFFNLSTLAAFDTNALITQLKLHPEQRFILNLVEKDNLPPHHPFHGYANVELNPFLPMQTFPEQVMEVFFYNYRRYLMGQSLSHRVCFQARR